MMSNSKTIISMKDVGVSYERGGTLLRKNKYWALNSVTFDLFQGETLGIIGKNGVGKSTLLKTLAGIIEPDKGVIESFSPLRISLLSLQVGFMPHLTGRENATMSGMLLGISRSDIEEKMSEIIEFSELYNVIDDPVYTYSTGMKARLGFSVALTINSDVILIDEVLGVGDAEFLQKSTSAMKNIIKSNKTVVLVSHNAELMKELCDRLVWIENGETLLQGDVDYVMSQYISSLNL